MKQIKSILINTICIVSLFGLMSCIKEIDLESLRPDPTFGGELCRYNWRTLNRKCLPYLVFYG